MHGSANICGLCPFAPFVTKEDIFEFGVDTNGRAFIDEKTADGCRRMLLYFVWQDELVENQETKDTQEHIFGTCSSTSSLQENWSSFFAYNKFVEAR